MQFPGSLHPLGQIPIFFYPVIIRTNPVFFRTNEVILRHIKTNISLKINIDSKQSICVSIEVSRGPHDFFGLSLVELF